jgi:hypothetical protein
LRNPEEKLESVLRDSTRNLIQHLTAIHGYLQLLQSEEMSTMAREIVRKLLDHDQRACSMLETLIGLERSQKNIGNHGSLAPVQPVTAETASQEVTPEAVPPHGSRVLLVGTDSAILDFQRQVLFHMGGDIVQESNLESTRTLLMNEPFDLVLIDENCLAAGQLEEFCSWIQAKRPQMRERIVFLIAAASQAEVEKLALRSLKKPLQLLELIQCSREFLPFAAAPQSSHGTVH